MNFDKTTVFLDSPFVSMLIRVPFDNSFEINPLNIITSTISPICVVFLKNCDHESKIVGSGRLIFIPSSINDSIKSGVNFATTGFIKPNIKNTVTSKSNLYVLVNSKSSFFVNAKYALILLPP